MDKMTKELIDKINYDFKQMVKENLSDENVIVFSKFKSLLIMPNMNSFMTNFFGVINFSKCENIVVYENKEAFNEEIIKNNHIHVSMINENNLLSNILFTHSTSNQKQVYMFGMEVDYFKRANQVLENLSLDKLNTIRIAQKLGTNIQDMCKEMLDTFVKNKIIAESELDIVKQNYTNSDILLILIGHFKEFVMKENNLYFRDFNLITTKYNSINYFLKDCDLNYNKNLVVQNIVLKEENKKNAINILEGLMFKIQKSDEIDGLDDFYFYGKKYLNEKKVVTKIAKKINDFINMNHKMFFIYAENKLKYLISLQDKEYFPEVLEFFMEKNKNISINNLFYKDIYTLLSNVNKEKYEDLFKKYIPYLFEKNKINNSIYNYVEEKIFNFEFPLKDILREHLNTKNHTTIKPIIKTVLKDLFKENKVEFKDEDEFNIKMVLIKKINENLEDRDISLLKRLFEENIEVLSNMELNYDNLQGLSRKILLDEELSVVSKNEKIKNKLKI